MGLTFEKSLRSTLFVELMTETARGSLLCLSLVALNASLGVFLFGGLADPVLADIRAGLAVYQPIAPASRSLPRVLTDRDSRRGEVSSDADAGVARVGGGTSGRARPVAESPPLLPQTVRLTPGRVHDGDTVARSTAHVWPGVSVFVSVRLRGIDTPELNGDCPRERAAAVAARDALRALVENAERVEVRDPEHDRYAGRVVGTLLLDGEDAAALLLAAGHGVPYDGGRRPRWC